MKPAAFNYHRPGSVDEALAMQAACEDPRFLAGGQSLVPMMSLRLAAPTDLIDLNAIDELSGVSHRGRSIGIGAMTRQEDLARHETLCDQVPVMRAVVESVGHPGTRTRGTIGGSLCHADPSAELPALLLALGAEVHITSLGGAARQLGIENFFGGHFENTLGATELLSEIRLPTSEHRQMGFHEVALRSADFATAGAFASIERGEDGAPVSVRVVAFALGDRPQRLREVEAALADAGGEAEAINAAAQLTAELVSPPDEPHLSATYRRRLGVVSVRRALEAAFGTKSAEVNP